MKIMKNKVAKGYIPAHFNKEKVSINLLSHKNVLYSKK